MLRATVDANILVSGFAYRRGRPFQLLKRALEGEVNLTVSQPIIDEALEVLSRKFGYPPEDIAEVRALISQAARIVVPMVELQIIKGRSRRQPRTGMRCISRSGVYRDRRPGSATAGPV